MVPDFAGRLNYATAIGGLTAGGSLIYYRRILAPVSRECGDFLDNSHIVHGSFIDVVPRGDYY